MNLWKKTLFLLFLAQRLSWSFISLSIILWISFMRTFKEGIVGLEYSYQVNLIVLITQYKCKHDIYLLYCSYLYLKTSHNLWWPFKILFKKGIEWCNSSLKLDENQRISFKEKNIELLIHKWIFINWKFLRAW